MVEEADLVDGRELRIDGPMQLPDESRHRQETVGRRLRIGAEQQLLHSRTAAEIGQHHHLLLRRVRLIHAAREQGRREAGPLQMVEGQSLVAQEVAAASGAAQAFRDHAGADPGVRPIEDQPRDRREFAAAELCPRHDADPQQPLDRPFHPPTLPADTGSAGPGEGDALRGATWWGSGYGIGGGAWLASGDEGSGG
jgi:hypothetical protein